jgi:Tfp pilus assembly protein PilF
LQWLDDRGEPSAELHVRLGVALLSQDDGHGAAATLRRAVAVDPQHAVGGLQVGISWLAVATPQAAVEAYRRAAELEPLETEAWIGWADALLQVGAASEAEQVLRQGVQAAPDSGDLCLALGLLLQQTGSDEASTWLLRAKQFGLDVDAASRGL